MKEFFIAIAFVVLTVVCWGMYGPVLHKGQAKMNNSRWRPFLCVGVAYFAIAVVVPVVVMQAGGDTDAKFSASGVTWSLTAGAAGAIGALGIIMAFNYGGTPQWVMPLVFGCAPVVNAFLTIYWAGTWKEVSPFFLAGLILVAMGAAMVLVFTPKKHGPTPQPAVAAATAESSGVSDASSSETDSNDAESPAPESAEPADKGPAPESDHARETDPPASG